jgi:hypothetical protein
MAPRPDRRKHAVPSRSILFQLCPHGPRFGVVRSTVGKDVVDYWLSRLPSDFGAALRPETFAPVEGEPGSL